MPYIQYACVVSVQSDEKSAAHLTHYLCAVLPLKKLSEDYAEDFIVLACYGAMWHKSATLIVPENIQLVFIPPYKPKMNPIEQIWEEIREKGFRNEVFKTLDLVVDRL